MQSHVRIWLLALPLAAAASRAAGGQERAPQAAGAGPSAELLRAWRDADSLRRVAEWQQAELARLQRALGAPSTAAPPPGRVQLTRVANGAPRAAAPDLSPRAARRDSAAADSAVTPPESAPAAAPAAAPGGERTTAAAPASTAARAIEVGIGRIIFSGLLQGWLVTGDAHYRSTFRVRRTELKFVGDVTPKAQWTIAVDPSKLLSVSNSSATIDSTQVVTETSVNQGSRMLQDAFVSLGYVPGVRIDVGAQKLPLGLEGLQPSSTLETVERAMFTSERARGAGLGEVRDVGATARGTLFTRLDVHVGAFNGSGESQNDVDRNNGKVYGGRLVFRPPLLAGLQLGGSGTWGGVPKADTPRHDRLGAELLYRYRRLQLKSELMTGRDGALARRGGYSQLAYRMPRDVELVARYDAWDPDTRQESSASNGAARDYVAGVNAYLSGNNVKLQANYIQREYHDGIAPTRHMLLVNVQTSW